MKFLFEFLIITLCCSILLTQTESSPAIFNGDEWVLIDSSSSEQSLPSPKTYPNQVSNAQIFIAIASFRDNRCSVTLKNLFSKAKNPERINIGKYQ